MFVQRKRFVKKNTGLYVENSLLHVVRPLVAVLVVFVLFVFALSIFVFNQYVSLYTRIDPEIYSVLSSTGRAVVYVSAFTEIGVENVIEKWVFGDLRIYKLIVHSASEVNKLISTSGVFSIYGEKKFKHQSLLYYDVNRYNFTVDIDNVFHRATGVWTGRGVVVAVIDTGVDYTHPDFFDGNKSIIRVLVSVLYRNISSSEKFLMWDLDLNPNIDLLLDFDLKLYRERGEPAFLDINGHGTHVAGIIAGRGHASSGKYRGIAPGSRLIIIKSFDKYGFSTIDLCLTALEWVYNYTEIYDISILNLSWGASFASDGSDPLSLAVDKLVNKGVWVFIAAGNAGNYPNTIHVPAVSKLGFAVGAWDPYYNVLASFSSLGPTIDGRLKPDFIGAGVLIVAPKSRYVDFPDRLVVNEYYVALSGTSMATPVVAGVAAVFIEYYVYWFKSKPSPLDFVNYVVNNGFRVNVFYKDFITGYGAPLAPR